MRDRLSTGPDIKGIRIREKRFSFGSFDLVHDSSQKDWGDVSSISLFTEVELEGYQILFVDFFLKVDTVQKQVNPVEDCLPRMDSEVGKKDRTRHLTSSASIAILTLGARGVKESEATPKGLGFPVRYFSHYNVPLPAKAERGTCRPESRSKGLTFHDKIK